MIPPARTLKRIGHKGADLIAPGNTIESFDAALAAGVDMVEFDVLPEDRDGSGRLVLAHDYDVVDRGDALTLEEGLAHFSQDAWAGVELNVDMKREGYERRVVDALREHGLADRALISTMEEDSLAVVRLAGGAVMGHVHLRVAEIPATTAFYCDALGFGLMAAFGAQASFMSAGGYHHHLGANTWESRGNRRAPPGHATLEQVTIVLPEAADVARLAHEAAAVGAEPESREDGVLVRDSSGNPVLLTTRA